MIIRIEAIEKWIESFRSATDFHAVITEFHGVSKTVKQCHSAQTPCNTVVKNSVFQQLKLILPFTRIASFRESRIYI